mgnify:CR=1 FL=1
MAGSDQIQGIKLTETDTTTYGNTDVLLGSDSEGNPQTINLLGPIVGMKGSYELDFDSLQFYIDEDYCHRSSINDFTL